MEREVVNVEEMLSNVIGDEFDRMEEAKDSKERQMAFTNALRGVNAIYAAQKIQQEAYENGIRNDLEKSRQEMNAAIENNRALLEETKLEFEKQKAENELRIANEEAEHRKRQMKMDILKMGVEVGIVVGTALFQAAMLTRASAWEETGTYKSTFSKHTIKKIEDFDKKCKRIGSRNL